MSIAKETLGLNKGEFNKKIGEIITNHRVGAKIIGKPKEFVLIACRLTERYSKVANEDGVEVRMKNMHIGPRKVKCLHLKRKDGREQPVMKGQLVDQLYPAKTIKTSASPEKKNALAVRSAMRQMVDYQLRAFRQCVRMPAECVHTGKIIRMGIKWDVDHIGKPFVQMCDEWVALHNMSYTDLALMGPPNLKRFRDTKLQKHWVLYHETHATLAPATAKANRAAGSGEYQASEALLGSFSKEDPDDIDMDF